MDALEHKPRVLVIAGATCTGKTALAAAIARRIPAEIVSADSRQIYQMLDIGTAKPPKELLAEIQHHFIDILNPDVEYNAAQFGAEARKTIAEIFARNRQPIVAGGLGVIYPLSLRRAFRGNEQGRDDPQKT